MFRFFQFFCFFLFLVGPLGWGHNPVFSHVFDIGCDLERVNKGPVQEESFSSIDFFDKSDVSLFLDLSFTDEDQKLLLEFLLELDMKTVPELLLDYESIVRKKERLKKIHPLRYIAHVVLNPSFASHVQSIRSSRVKWGVFTAGFERSLKRCKASDSLDRYISGFSQYIQGDSELIRKYVDQDNYGLLLDYLFDIYG